jgi:uncharacterized OB-fold protein
MEITRHWRLKTQRYRLKGPTCPVCGQLIFPPRPVCPDCIAHSTQMTGYAPMSLLALTATSISKSILFQIILKGN